MAGHRHLCLAHTGGPVRAGDRRTTGLADRLHRGGGVQERVHQCGATYSIGATLVEERLRRIPDEAAGQVMDRYRALIDAHVESWIGALPDDPLYAPMAYLMRLPAKRVRPALMLIGCELFGGRAEDILDEAVGI